MNALPLPARLYIVTLFGLSLLLAGVCALSLDSNAVATVAVLAVLIAALDKFKVVVQRNRVEFTISTALQFSTVLLFPAEIVITSTFLGTFAAELFERRALHKKLLNSGLLTVTAALSVWAFGLTGGRPGAMFTNWTDLGALVAVAVTNILFNSVGLSLVIALATRASVVYIWMDNFPPVLWHDLSLFPLGAVIALLWKASPWAVIFSVIPLVLVHYSEQGIFELRRQTMDALLALARILDERDEDTHNHCLKVADHSTLIATTMGLSQSEIDVLTRAAYLHDIGKVGMSNSILFKPGVLTPTERDQAKRHAAIGGDLLAKFSVFERGALYVRHHHERWDGEGYPDGLQGVRIPQGARIIAVADAYQAMVEDRPYRKGLAPEKAMEQLALYAGTQFDPEVVRAFLKANHYPLPAIEPIAIERAPATPQ